MLYCARLHCVWRIQNHTKNIYLFIGSSIRFLNDQIPHNTASAGHIFHQLWIEQTGLNFESTTRIHIWMMFFLCFMYYMLNIFMRFG